MEPVNLQRSRATRTRLGKKTKSQDLAAARAVALREWTVGSSHQGLAGDRRLPRSRKIGEQGFSNSAIHSATKPRSQPRGQIAALNCEKCVHVLMLSEQPLQNESKAVPAEGGACLSRPGDSHGNPCGACRWLCDSFAFLGLCEVGQEPAVKCSVSDRPVSPAGRCCQSGSVDQY